MHNDALTIKLNRRKGDIHLVKGPIFFKMGLLAFGYVLFGAACGIQSTFLEYLVHEMSLGQMNGIVPIPYCLHGGFGAKHVLPI